ncbi:MAG: Co2+/Mg2+ efflux protein ApaG [Polyangiaceae bacterium]|nr:Co2+/Mg2+ efflux protein ApaG [Polyangiaceae bacterium]
MPGSSALTDGVLVQVESRFAPEHSDPGAGEWFFLYRIRITNEGDRTVKLLARHWVITDANGELEEVAGPGVVGRQPILEPGQSFEYTSGCPLKTPFGSMRGTYELVRQGGESFQARIADFALSQPNQLE